MSAGARAFDALPKGHGRPTAVLAMSDMAAIGVMSAAQASGLTIPGDLSVVGYDDVPMAAYTSPAYQDVYAFGLLILMLLIRPRGLLAAGTASARRLAG